MQEAGVQFEPGRASLRLHLADVAERKRPNAARVSGWFYSANNAAYL
jgi:hypothetical protein